MADRSVADKLCSASASGKLPEVLSLLKNGADVNGINTHNRTALQVGINLFLKLFKLLSVRVNLEKCICSCVVFFLTVVW